MPHSRSDARDANDERWRRAARRSKRGLIAGYIHELSARHRPAASTPVPAARPAQGADPPAEPLS